MHDSCVVVDRFPRTCGSLESINSQRLTEWVEYYNHQRYHDRVAGAITRQCMASRCLLGPPSADLGRAAKKLSN